jgi:Domain of unknown function (DUF4388)
MLNLATGTSTLEVLLRESGVVTGAVLATSEGEVLAMTGSVRPGGDDLAAVAALLTRELATMGTSLGLGLFSVASLKGEASARVFAAQGDSALVVEVDARRPLTELESRLRSSQWSTWRVPAGFEAGAITAEHPAFNADGTAASAPERSRATAGPATIRRASIPLPQGSVPRPLRGPPPPPPAAYQAAGSGADGDGAPRSRPAMITRPRPTHAEGSGQARLASSESAFSGGLEEFALPDLLEFMRNGVRTGLLTCISDAGVGTVQLVRGLIVSAESPGARSLRDQLVSSAALPPERRREIDRLPALSFNDAVIDAALVETKLLSAEEVELARVARVYAAFREMISWTTGRFSFEPGVSAERQPGLQLTAQSVLLQIFQEQDERAR